MKPQSYALLTAGVVGGTGLMGVSQIFNRGTNDHLEGMKYFKGYSKIGGVVPTNNIFNWVRVGIGAAGVLAAQSPKAAVVYNRSVAVSYAGMALMGLFKKTDTMFGLMPIFGANVALHSGITAGELLTEEKLVRGAKKMVNQSIAPQAKKIAKSKVVRKAKKVVSESALMAKAAELAPIAKTRGKSAARGRSSRSSRA
jgi:hypothetical protein